ncbi:MAG: DUF1294 domain-containing protein [Chloroflexi bacterium]|nr:DUF1294 domain-containing protein [Chloroflexota bacterium]
MMIIGAFCLSLLLLIFFFMFLSTPSDGRSRLLQMGSLAMGAIVLGTAVFAALNQWPPPIVCGFPANWTAASWAGLSMLTFLLYWYDQQATLTDVRRISGWALFLLSLAGGWAGAFGAQFVLRVQAGQMSLWVLTAVAALTNFVFWTWLSSQVI